MTEPAGHALELRPAADSDFETVVAITMATMRAYVEATWGIWDEAEHRSRIRDSFEPSTHRLVHVDGQLAGLLAAKEHAEYTQLIKVFLLPPFQGRGIGTRLVRQVMAQAATQERPVRLRVLRVNPAQRLYLRLGFVITDETPERLYMEWRPGREPRAT
jgi:GNAT superfamily N-acetyltransferase